VSPAERCLQVGKCPRIVDSDKPTITAGSFFGFACRLPGSCEVCAFLPQSNCAANLHTMFQARSGVIWPLLVS
jgi:hypothetical protein